MKTVAEILDILKTDFENDMPGLLTAKGLADFDEYVIGDSRDDSNKSLCIYKADLRQDAYENRISFIIQLQLTNVQYYDAERYGDTVREYIRVLTPTRIGLDYLDKLDDETWPMDKVNTTFINIMPEYIETLDSCSEENV